VLGDGGYRLQVFSDVHDRDGLGVELYLGPSRELVAEVFRDDTQRTRTVRFFTDRPVPLSAVEALLECARTELGAFQPPD
jgi:hypothetical protein